MIRALLRFLRTGTKSSDYEARVKAMELRQREYGKKLRRQGRTLLANKYYIPVLTKPSDPPYPPPMASKVVPILRRKP